MFGVCVYIRVCLGVRAGGLKYVYNTDSFDTVF